jgi:hypothetical protein
VEVVREERAERMRVLSLILDRVVGGGGGKKERVRRHQHAQPIQVPMAEFQILDLNFAQTKTSCRNEIQLSNRPE